MWEKSRFETRIRMELPAISGSIVVSGLTMDQEKIINFDEYWNAISSRDSDWDSRIVFGVKTTGIYCLPSCPSKRPKRESVMFFTTNEEAEAAGFRPCKRCQPEKATERAAEFARVIKILDDPAEEITYVGDWASKAGLTPEMLRRMTLKNAGLSPRDILNQKKINTFRSAIQMGEGVSSSQYSAGYGSSSRLYEKAGEFLGMTPGQYRRKGQNVKIQYTIIETRLGMMLIAGTDRGVCSLQFGDTREEVLHQLSEEFSAAELVENPRSLDHWVHIMEAYLDGREKKLDIPLDVNATIFRTKVWEAIRRIPYGETRSYSNLADEIGKPSAARAVASACAANPVALVTPCHRVVHGDGSISGYRWGIERKRELLEMEKGRAR
jgi:AraC family transcriptional regulator, regulatory protein of adaptative response / methylated-DNA-[protein]-cysteine methyltransferase